MPTDPQEALVEALAKWAYEEYRPGKGMESARDFIATHRLVSLPEEPTEWEAEIERDGWYTYGSCDRVGAERLAADFRATGRIRPVYHIPGPPIDATEET